MNILVIEDEQSLARFISKGLQQAGYGTQVCNDGAQGLEIAASEKFDLILLDLMLPGTNGFDILNNLRSFKIKTPVIIISALSDTAQVVARLDLGPVDYIKKPFEWDELLARIRVLQKKISGHESAKIH